MNADRLRKVVTISLGAVALTTGSMAWADVGLPISIKMPRNTPQAVAGQEYDGKFLLHVFKAGTLDDFRIAGEGWNIVAFTPPAPARVQPGVIEIPFRAIPTDTDKRIGLTLTYNGQTVHRAYKLGPSGFGRNREQNRLRRLDDNHRELVGPPLPTLDARDADQGAADVPGARAQAIHVTGRIVYTRPCRDLRDPNTGDPPDGDCDDPWDIPARVVGVDGIDVRLLDNDTVGSEEMWSGYTDINGYFDTGVFSWEGSTFDPDPDLVIYAETEVAGLVDVTDDSVGEYTYWFETPEVTDFTGSSHNFGTLTPSDSGLFPALHLFNSISRAHRYVKDVASNDLAKVQVMWPDDSRVGGAWYADQWDPPEIHVSTQRQWQEDTHTHEYGHHYVQMMYAFDFPEVDYCNDPTAYCDNASGVPGCYAMDIQRCGHCQWCQETDHDAFGEGFPNWLADVVTRDYPARYTFDDGSEFTALFSRSQEGIGNCCQDDQPHNPFLTEGFIGALLRDIEDDTQDDHDSDGIIDTLCTGPGPIFDVVDTYQPITVNDFITGFRASYPSYADEFYPTAFNVSPQFVAGLPADTAPPDPVAYVSSPSHPLLTGGPLPCITVQWLPVDDDRGACFYSYRWSGNAGGMEPDETPDAVSTDGCYLQSTAWNPLGQSYFSIKAQDCPDENGNPGSWGPTVTFGPFTVTDCNGSGDLDICDIRCCSAGCVAGPASCPTSVCLVSSCETSEDCNGNYAPDECDIADGTSEDCNLNGIPDECENMSHWDGVTGSWHVAANWLEGTPPTAGAEVCIDVPDSPTVTYSNAALNVGTLACSENLNITGGSFPWAELTLNSASWIDGDLGLSGNLAKLTNNAELSVGGTLHCGSSATLTGPGTTVVDEGMQLASGVLNLTDHTLELSGTSVSNGRLDMWGTPTLHIKPGATYEHQSSFSLNSGWFNQLIHNEGTIIKTTDPGTSWIDSYLVNDGEVRVEAGTLRIARYSSSTGDFVGMSGAILDFYGGNHDFLAGSSIVAQDVAFTAGAGGANNVRGTYNISGSTSVTGGHTLTFHASANIINYGADLTICGGPVYFDHLFGGPVNFNSITITCNTAYFNSGDPINTVTLDHRGIIRGPSDITVSGLMTWNPGGWIMGPSTVNANGGLLVTSGSSERMLYNRVFNNAGIATILGWFSMSSSAVFNNLSTGVIDIQVDGGVISGIGQTLNNAGTLVKTAGIGTSTISVNFSNTGTVEAQNGKLEFYGGFSMTHTQTAGQTILNGGDLAFTLGMPFNIQGGVLAGIGLITGNVVNTGGRVEPGLSIGELTINGTYTQGPAASLGVELGGSLQGEYDTLVCTGNVSLAGDLEVVLINSFEPQRGDTFQIVQGGSVTGEFEQVSVTNLPPQMQMVAYYTPTTVTLIVPPLDGDCNGDYIVGLDDLSEFVPCLAGPQGGLGQDCDCGDINGDGNVDLSDIGMFQVNFTGPLP